MITQTQHTVRINVIVLRNIGDQIVNRLFGATDKLLISNGKGLYHTSS